MSKQLTLLLLLLAMTLTASAQLKERDKGLRETRSEFFTTDEARRIGDQVLLYQRVTGGWPKNINMARPLTADEKAAIAVDKQRRDDSTTDNGATTMQMTFLARLYQATKDVRYRDAVRQAVDEGLCTRGELFITSKLWVTDMKDEDSARRAIDAMLAVR